MTDKDKSGDRPTRPNEEKGRVIKEDNDRRYDGTVQPSTVGESDADRPNKPKK